MEMDGNMRRAIDLREGETLDEAAFKRLIRAAVAANAAALAERRAQEKIGPAQTRASGDRRRHVDLVWARASA
jgi:hypothetical protein